mmetsp:Transcript_11583/g.12735  ORF Transcript_11583/g.12735 Transcript_11583/m.12735 type:complete len:257 (-) Transcript_11583:522-1292(-)
MVMLCRGIKQRIPKRPLPRRQNHSKLLDLRVVNLGLHLLVLSQFTGSLHKIFFYDVISLRTDGKHTSLSTNISQIGTIEIVTELNNGIIIDISLLSYGFGMNFQNFASSGFIGERNFDLSIQSSGSEKCGIQNIGSVRRHNHLNLSKVIESIQLVQKLHQCSLDFTIGTGTLRESPSTDSINFVHKNNARLMFFSISKHFSDNSCTLSNIFINNSRSHHLHEFSFNVRSHSSCDQSLSGSGWTIHQNTLGGFNANS